MRKVLNLQKKLQRPFVVVLKMMLCFLAVAFPVQCLYWPGISSISAYMCGSHYSHPCSKWAEVEASAQLEGAPHLAAFTRATWLLVTAWLFGLQMRQSGWATGHTHSEFKLCICCGNINGIDAGVSCDIQAMRVLPSHVNVLGQ